MRIYVDEHICESDAGCIGEAISAGATVAEDYGRIVIDVVVDGERWDEQRLDSEESRANDASEIRLTTAVPEELVGDAFLHAADALVRADEVQRAAAEHLQADRGTEALDQLQEAMTIWTSVQETVTRGAALAGLALDEVTVGDRPARTIIGQLATELTELRSALEAGDPVGMADCLLYRMPEVVTDWRALLDALRREVETGNADPSVTAGATDVDAEDPTP